jgi:hypothetical protein
MTVSGASGVHPASGSAFGASSQSSRGGSALSWAFTVLLLSVTVLERFGINLGTYSLNAALPAMYGLLMIAALNGVLCVSVRRLTVYLLSLAAAAVSMFFNQDRSSTTSMILLMAIYLPFVFVLSPSPSVSQHAILRTYLNISLFCAVAGIAQFYAQFFFHDHWLFDFTSHIPAALRGPTGYNTTIPVGAHFKSNGFFFREPSGCSFTMALALVAEYLTYRRLLRMACLSLALLLTYSGTGLLALVIGLLIPLNRTTFLRVMFLGLGGVALFFVLDGVLNLSFTASRALEFGSERSSAYIRYIAPGQLLADTLTSDAWSPWIGHGPGTILRTAATYEFHDPTWAKLIYEYGLAGFFLFQVMLAMALRGTEAPPSIRAVLFAGWLVMGGHLLSPEQNFLTLALVGMFTGSDERLPLHGNSPPSPRPSTSAAALPPLALT